MRIDSDIHARATGTFSDENSARNIGDLARGALAVAKLQVARQQPDMVHVLDGIQVSNSGPTPDGKGRRIRGSVEKTAKTVNKTD